MLPTEMCLQQANCQAQLCEKVAGWSSRSHRPTAFSRLVHWTIVPQLVYIAGSEQEVLAGQCMRSRFSEIYHVGKLISIVSFAGKLLESRSKGMFTIII